MAFVVWHRIGHRISIFGIRLNRSIHIRIFVNPNRDTLPTRIGDNTDGHVLSLVCIALSKRLCEQCSTDRTLPKALSRLNKEADYSRLNLALVSTG